MGISVNGARAGALTFSSKAENMFLPLTYTSTAEVLDAFDRINYTGKKKFLFWIDPFASYKNVKNWYLSPKILFLLYKVILKICHLRANFNHLFCLKILTQTVISFQFGRALASVFQSSVTEDPKS